MGSASQTAKCKYYDKEEKKEDKEQKKEEKKIADKNGCYDHGERGYWCPDGKGGWVDKKSGKQVVADGKGGWVEKNKEEHKEEKEEGKEEKDEGPGKDGCYDKGD